ncbi:MAG: Membrane protein insertase YidC [Candidatus Hinthialibacteria bacterium OLB16]|nr:MAG: Membrane protein insertase YidC [Candidatus Hinthialibacteria bacterium OLB16]
MIPQGEASQGVYIAENIGQRPSIDTRMGIGLVTPLTGQPSKFIVYAGPKLSDTLAKLGGGLDRVVYDSWFGSICLLVEWLLALFYSVIPSYGVAIILLCVFSKVALYPLTYKQAQTQMRMAALQPKIAELKEKFKDDSQKLSQEQMKLWKKHGVNPASGCLPMLAQLPIFIALYRTIQSSIDLRGAPFLWISDLSLPDMTFFLPANLPFLGNALNILPVLMTLISLWQMHEQKKMMPDPNQAQIMMFMTAFFFFHSLSLLERTGALLDDQQSDSDDSAENYGTPGACSHTRSSDGNSCRHKQRGKQ